MRLYSYPVSHVIGCKRQEIGDLFWDAEVRSRMCSHTPLFGHGIIAGSDPKSDSAVRPSS